MSPEAPDEILDPVAAYDRLAPIYTRLCAARRQYLTSVEELIASRVPSGSRSLLDIGSGDGRRALRIFELARLVDVVLLEPSSGMSARIPKALLWAVRAEDLHVGGPDGAGRVFDVITCLWNVLGHIRPETARLQVLRRLGQMLSPNGLLFLDLNHRYNARCYGLLKTLGRFAYDHLRPGERNGDVIVSWELGSTRCATHGHVFTDGEVRKLAAASDLAIAERLVVDYRTGKLQTFSLGGNLLYALRRAPQSGLLGPEEWIRNGQIRRAANRSSR